MEKYFDVLRKCTLFNSIQDSDLIPMLSFLGARVESFDKKYTVFTEGNPAKYIGIVLSGSAQITANDFYGNRTIVSSVEPSELFGEAFACADLGEIPVTVVANEPCEIMLIECRRILYACSNACGFHQQLIFNLVKDLAAKNIMCYQKIEITSKRTTREKLMTYLMLQAKKAKRSSFDIPFDRQELADYLEVERSGLSQEIGKLTKEGIIRSRKKHFELI